MTREERKKSAFQIALIVMSIYFSMIENMIPKPFPWIKFGFSNIAAVIGMERFGPLFGIEITVLRILIYSFISGTFMSPNFFIGFSAGVLSVIAMGGIFWSRKFSSVAASSAAGFLHNLFQMAAAYLLFFRNIDITGKWIVMFVSLFLLFGAVSGFVVGIAASKFTLIKKKN